MKAVKDLLLKKYDIRINILSFIYSLLSVFGYSYKNVGNASLVFKNIANFSISIITFILLFLIYRIIIKFIFNLLSKKEKEVNYKNKYIKYFFDIFNKRPMLISMIIMIICWLPYIYSYYPVILSPDPSFQIKQYFHIDNKYSTYSNLIDKNVIITNHHPVIHTLLLGTCLKLGHSIGNDNLGLFIYSVIQILILSSVLAYTIRYMKKIDTSVKTRFIILLIYSLVPMFPFYSISAVKDVIFTSLVILYNIFVFDTLINKKDKISNLKFIMFLITMIFVVLFRNNGIHMIMLSFPFLILACRNNFKKLGLLFILILSFNYSYNNIVLPYFKITPGSKREILSIPFQQTARFVKYDYDKLNKDEVKKIDKVLDIKDLADRYEPELSDKVKNKYNKNATDEDLKEYFKVWLNCLFKDPTLYIDATINNTYGYFYPPKLNWYVYHGYNKIITEDGFNYHFNSFKFGRRNLGRIGVYFVYIPIIGLLSNIGANTWMLFLLVAYMLYNKKKEGIVILLPSLILLLVCVASPANTYFRYAMPYVFAMPMLVVFTKKYIERSDKDE